MPAQAQRLSEGCGSWCTAGRVPLSSATFALWPAEDSMKQQLQALLKAKAGKHTYACRHGACSRRGTCCGCGCASGGVRVLGVPGGRAARGCALPAAGAAAPAQPDPLPPARVGEAAWRQGVY